MEEQIEENAEPVFCINVAGTRDFPGVDLEFLGRINNQGVIVLEEGGTVEGHKSLVGFDILYFVVNSQGEVSRCGTG